MVYLLQVTSSTDLRRSSSKIADNRVADDDDRLSSALNSICMADGEIGFLDSLSSLSMESSTNPSALSPTALVAAATPMASSSLRNSSASYFAGNSSNMVVNDMGTALSQLHAEETSYYMTIHAWGHVASQSIPSSYSDRNVTCHCCNYTSDWFGVSLGLWSLSENAHGSSDFRNEWPSASIALWLRFSSFFL